MARSSEAFPDFSEFFTHRFFVIVFFNQVNHLLATDIAELRCFTHNFQLFRIFDHTYAVDNFRTVYKSTACMTIHKADEEARRPVFINGYGLILFNIIGQDSDSVHIIVKPNLVALNGVGKGEQLINKQLMFSGLR